MSKRKNNRKLLEGTSREVAQKIAAELPPGMGFAFMVFDFESGGHLAWISNATPETMLLALQEQIERLKSRTATTKGDA